MAVSYKKLWKLLIDKDMKKKDLCEKAGISPASVTKMGRNSENGPFSNVNPVTNNWIAGFVGVSGIHIDCVANYDESRVGFYLGTASKEQNKALFDFPFARKDIIEAAMGTQLIWSRMDDNKASKIHISLPSADISKDTDWPRMTKFHVDASKGLYLAFKEPLEEYFNISL